MSAAGLSADASERHAGLQANYDDVVKEVAQYLTGKAKSIMQLGLPRYEGPKQLLRQWSRNKRGII